MQKDLIRKAITFATPTVTSYSYKDAKNIKHPMKICCEKDLFLPSQNISPEVNTNYKGETLIGNNDITGSRTT